MLPDNGCFVQSKHAAAIGFAIIKVVSTDCVHITACYRLYLLLKYTGMSLLLTLLLQHTLLTYAPEESLATSP